MHVKSPRLHLIAKPHGILNLDRSVTLATENLKTSYVNEILAKAS